MQFVKTIQNFAFQNDLWGKGSKIVVGVSGGSDSSCLLSVLKKLESKYDLKLHVAHVNYGLRGADSDHDEEFVRKLAEKYDIEISVLKPKKSQYKGNLENSLRDIRYNFFEKIRKELDFDLIAVAHNQDDQAETVLMRIIRGSGLNGLSAMKAKAGFVIRPLLQTSKKDILAYLKQNKLKFCTDKSNLDERFTRNGVRHGLLPYLEKNFNPRVKQTLGQWSLAVADDYEFINQSAESFVQAVCKNKCADFLEKEFLKMHLSLQRQVLRNIFGKLKSDTKDIENRQIEEMLKVIKSSKSKTQKAVIGGLNISKKGDKIGIFCSK